MPDRMPGRDSWTKTLLAPARFLSGPREAKCSVSLAQVVNRALECQLPPARRARLEKLRAVLCMEKAPRFDEPEAILQNVCGRALDHAEERNVPLILHCACRRVYVRDTFAEALFHLLDNAINANRSGHPVIVDVRDEVEGHTLWQIHDMGLGMAPTVLAELGDPFWRLHDDGSGLGVAIANAIIQEHQGILRFESGVGVGTTATVWLPAA